MKHLFSREKDLKYSETSVQQEDRSTNVPQRETTSTVKIFTWIITLTLPNHGTPPKSKSNIPKQVHTV